jgi:hypothetical protein
MQSVDSALIQNSDSDPKYLFDTIANIANI